MGHMNQEEIVQEMEQLDVGRLVQELRDVFASGKTRNADWRKEQLRGLERLATERVEEIKAALKADLNKPTVEAMLEVRAIATSAASTAAQLDQWMTPEQVTSPVPFLAKSTIIPEPLGVTLVIAPWNYPLALSLEPLVGAIAAGNTVVIKPSELASATSALLAKLVPLYVDSSAIRVVEGGIPEASALLEEKWDKIFYTGSTNVGKIVLTAAAKYLTPVTLELGGKSPVIVDTTADLDVVAKRVAYGKWSMNNGQTCLSPDYVLVEESIAPELIKNFQNCIKQFYGEDPSKSSDLSRVINNSHFDRLTGLLKDEQTSQKLIHGGQKDEKSLYIEPTLIKNPPLTSPVMQEEIFGPLLVIITVKDISEAIKIVNSQPKPLALYIFSTDEKVVDQIVYQTSSGGVTVNDTILHAAHPGLPFGGVGESGMGSYHGKFSFDAFSHTKPVLYQSLTVDIPERYPPHKL